MTADVTFSHGSKGRLTARDFGRFPTDRLFDRIGRAVCAAGCLPRKELYEAWEVARRVRRLCRGGRVVDLCAGHGLLAHMLLLLDDSSASALVVDAAISRCADKVHAAVCEAWPRLDGRVSFVEAPIESVQLNADDLVVSSHACGRTTDVVLDRAAAAGARVAVLPCCHDRDECDRGGIDGWVDAALAIDTLRAIRLRDRGYRIATQTIPPEITPKNRLLIGVPASGAGL